jgi:hypothetical protein
MLKSLTQPVPNGYLGVRRCSRKSQANFNRNRESKILQRVLEDINISQREDINNRQMCYHGAAHFEVRPNGNQEPLDPRGLVVDVEFDPTNARVRYCKELRNSNALRKLTDRSLRARCELCDECESILLAES